MQQVCKRIQVRGLTTSRCETRRAGVWRAEARGPDTFFPRGVPDGERCAWDGGVWRTEARGPDTFSPEGSQMGSDVLRTVAFGELRLEGPTRFPQRGPRWGAMCFGRWRLAS